MNKQYVVMLIVVAGLIPVAYAQTEVPEMDINVSVAQAVVIGIGIAGGITSAYLGMAKAKNAATKENPYVFNQEKFINRVVLATLTSIGLAITAAAGFLELTLVTMYLIFMASLGTASTISALKNN